MSIAQGFGQGQTHGRERTDSINSTTERTIVSPLAGLPSGESIRALASSSGGVSSGGLMSPPRPSVGARRESQIEREEHRTTTDQQDVLAPGDMLEPVEGGTGGLEGVAEDYEMGDEEGSASMPPTTPFDMMGLRRGREDILGSFSGALPVIPTQNGDMSRKRKWKLEKKLGDGAFSEVWAGSAIDEEGENSQSNGESPLTYSRRSPQNESALISQEHGLPSPL